MFDKCKCKAILFITTNKYIMEIILNTQSGNVLISYQGKKYSIRLFTHPIKKTNLYMFETSVPMLGETYPLHGLMDKKKRYANIFNEAMQNKIKNYLNEPLTKEN